jgi:hypothetical protein
VSIPVLKSGLKHESRTYVLIKTDIGGMIAEFPYLEAILRRNPILIFLLILTISALACQTSVPTSPPVQPVTPLGVTALAPTSVPAGTQASATTPEAAETQAAGTTPQTSTASILIQGVDNKFFVVGADGQSTPFAEADQPFNSPLFSFNPGNRAAGNTLYALSGQSNPTKVYTVKPGGAAALGFIQQVSQGLAIFGGQPVRLAWDANTIDRNNNTVSSILFTSAADGSNLKQIVTESGTQLVLVALKWSKDGQKIYFSKEHLGLGGYILFGGSSNLWAYNMPDSKVTELLKTPDVICIDDLSPDETLVAQHCKAPNIGITQISSGVTATINPPEQMSGVKFSGSARFSPDGKRVAFGLARGNPDAEEGWAAVSDGLTGVSRLVATAPQGTYFQVAGWLDGNTMLLQSWGATPGVWVVKVDGNGLTKIADGVYHGIVNTGQ